MRRTRLARVAAVLVALGTLGGAAGLLYPRAGLPAADGRPDRDQLQGAWAPVAVTFGGVSDSPDIQRLRQGMEVVFEGDKAVVLMDLDFRLDPTKTPRQIDLIRKEQNLVLVFPGIYELGGDRLKVCFNMMPGAARPAQFVSDKGSQVWLLNLKRKQATP
jgi:uncharacterized protein (TIGR03067 family)